MEILVRKSQEIDSVAVSRAILEAIRGADSFMEVEAITVLGSGKTDLKAVSDLAKARFGSD